MSTRSLIGIANANDTITYIYCHYDGYVKDGVGEALLNNFTNKRAVNKLLSGGAARTIDAEGLVSYFDDEGSGTIPNEEYALGEASSEYVYLFEPETKTWIYKNYTYNVKDGGMGVKSDWKLLVV